MIFGGLGLALANWLVLVLFPAYAAYWRRISVEEAELHRVLGETYGSYARERARLVPHVW